MTLIAWALVGSMALLDTAWCVHVGLSIDRLWIPAGAVGLLLAIAAAYRRRSRALSTKAGSGGLWIAFAVAGCVLTYLAATCSRPLQDAALTDMDRALGFDWLTLYDAMLAHPALHRTLALAYASLAPQITLSVLLLPARRNHEMVVLATLALLPTVAVSLLWPALGPFTAHAVTATYLPDLLALRGSGPWRFDAPALEGIVTMPAYHATLAVLFAYGWRGMGMLTGIAVALNAVMLLSVPPVGGHYLVDVLAGAVIALLAVGARRSVRP